MHFKLNIKETLAVLLAQEDTDGDKKITKEDQGPKKLKLQSDDGKEYIVKGTYHLSNLLQELALEKKKGKKVAEISLDQIEEPPTDRISRMIRDYFWDDLTRTIDRKGIQRILEDEKATDKTQRIYVPVDDKKGINYYKELTKELPQLQVITLPQNITPEYVRSINDKPGILALKLKKNKGVPFVVPGGRFNEMYGWDSYFEGIGLLLDGRIDLAKAMVDNFCYQVKHYGKILNANRSYYLTRTQPPFLTSFIREVYEAEGGTDHAWLSSTLEMAIKEYKNVWMVSGKRLTKNELNRYLAEGIGIPPETEDGHFDEVLKTYARKYELSLQEFTRSYTSGEINDDDLDRYFIHDRSLRESGHDTSWRLDGVCANLNCVDLNSLLFKYETDIAYLIETYFDDKFVSSKGKKYKSEYWQDLAFSRKARMNEYMWSKKHDSFFDYDIKYKKKTKFESASNFYPLWARLCSKEQAEKMVKTLFETLKQKGGISGTSKKMMEDRDPSLPQRQWDYPNGWAPHQMIIWKGLLNYGFKEEARELIYRWLWTITKNAVDYNGTIPEKYDVVACTHKVYAEYGNVGTEFDYITTSGFGWMNASYQYGLSLLAKKDRNNLNKLMDPDQLFN
ncbi:trehalase family glycosidase [Sungkyunkwania multivorans]|uniref:Trehalase family glycosidase n=1 Tax=Sungkyunkwania multivorans TaxID=1173618 RepID=A0ABW3CTB9_9FLAO